MSTLTELYHEMQSCDRCGLYKTANRVVPGEGPEDSRIMFVGEAPGFHEDQQGRPFVGAAGQFLEGLLASIGMKRTDVYITNIVKHRPPSNRDPMPGETIACRPWLQKQIELIRPKMIVTLGRYSMEMFFPGKTISKIHGTGQKKDGVVYFAMYHPAAALHQQSLRQAIEADMLRIPSLLAEVPKKEEETAPQPAQLKMFEL